MRILFTAALAASIAAAPAALADEAADIKDRFTAAVEAEDVAAIAGLYTEDAAFYGPEGGGVVTGGEAIAAGWTPIFEAFEDISVTLTPDGEMALGEDAHASWGTFEMTMTPEAGGEPVTQRGRYSDITVKTAEGWKYRVDHASYMGE